MWLLFGGHLDEKDKNPVIITKKQKKMKKLVWMQIIKKKFENNFSFLFIKIKFNLNTFYWHATYIYIFICSKSWIHSINKYLEVFCMALQDQLQETTKQPSSLLY